MGTKSGTEIVNFDANVKLEERDRKSQTVVVGFGLLLTTKPSIVRFEIEGTATLTGKDEDIRKMLEADPETKMPYILPRIYQFAFTSMYLMSTILNTPAPPQDLLGSQKQPIPGPYTGNLEVAEEKQTVEQTENKEESTDGAEVAKEEKTEPIASAK